MMRIIEKEESRFGGTHMRMKFFLKIELELGDTFWQRICLYFV